MGGSLVDLMTLLAWLCSGQALHKVHPSQSWLSVAARKTAPLSGAAARVLICLALISVSVRIVETNEQLKVVYDSDTDSEDE